MIGMNRIKKKAMTGLIIGIVVAVLGIAVTIFICVKTIKSYEDGTNAKFIANYMKEVKVLNKDVIQGEIITDDMVSTTKVHITTVPTNALTYSPAGKVAKYNISANVPLTENMVTDEIKSADVREQELNTIVMPSDLAESDYVDVRIMYTNGTDYIVLAQKQVKKIVGQTMWINLTEDERLLLNSAVVDSFLNPGTKLYAKKYTDPSAQIKSVIDSDVQDSLEVTTDSTTATTTTTGDTDTTTAAAAGTTNTSTTASTTNGKKENSITTTVKGYIKEQIKNELANIKAQDEQKATESIFNLIVKYKNFATSVTRTTENYQPNSQVMNMMKSNANIIDQAKEKLSEEARSNIESAISSYESQNEDSYNNVVTAAQQSITTQQSLRNEIISGGI